jgi:hypothetical protein
VPTLQQQLSTHSPHQPLRHSHYIDETNQRQRESEEDLASKIRTPHAPPQRQPRHTRPVSGSLLHLEHPCNSLRHGQQQHCSRRPSDKVGVRHVVEHRAQIIDEKTGGSTDISPDKLGDIEGFLDGWQQSSDTPQEFGVDAWQNADDDHPAGSGKPAYRIVYKTLRTVIDPRVVLQWPNLRVSIANGDINRGDMTTPYTIPARNQRHQVIPEHGRIIHIGNSNSYLKCPDLRYTFSGWEETVRALCYVEIIYIPELPEKVSIEKLYSVGRSS